uniref:Inositol polyphosphate-related phosphatase domain-containing protein n=1 Tax=Opuntia streptacantha TaxID=393608 RepID=A0A7C9ADM5_OPUST
MQPHHSRRMSSELVRKWLNISTRDSDFGADTDVEDDADVDTFYDPEDGVPRLRRQKSETFRAQYINKKELRICVGTWNVGGRVPPDDLDIDECLNISEPSDIYVLGLQEIVPLNAGNIFGIEDNKPVLKWENIIRETLGRVQPSKKNYKSFSDPPSPSKFKPLDDVSDIEEEILLGPDYDTEDEVHPIDEGSGGFYEFKDKMTIGDGMSKDDGISDGGEIAYPEEKALNKQFSSRKRLDRLQCFQTGLRDEDDESTDNQTSMKLKRALSETEVITFSWPEPPLNLLALLDRSRTFKTIKSLKASKSFGTQSTKLDSPASDRRTMASAAALAELDLESLVKRRRRPEYVRIVSKQMVGIFLTIWVRRHLRKHIQNLKVSTVGVGVMGYIGNKGAVCVSMSIYQTLFCFVCAHLTSGEKEVDQLKRNADVQEIHRRTIFRSDFGFGLPKTIFDHERIFWLGDLNYRISLPYNETRQLISKQEWSQLIEKDQLVREMKRGHVFDGWSEGVLNFPPTYKYEMNSDSYSGGDPKAGRRTPAWCDRILSFGKGIKLLEYRRSELKLSDHRPVTATYDVEVEVFSLERLQRALTFTTAEIKKEDLLT